MGLETGHECEGFVAHGAHERPLPGVQGPMVLEACETHKRLAAYPTRVHLRCVCVFVCAYVSLVSSGQEFLSKIN